MVYIGSTSRYRIVPSDSLYHHGIKGQKWGERNGPPYPLNRDNKEYANPKQLLNHMKSFKYKEYDTLMSADQVESSKTGSCHDQCMHEWTQLEKMGRDPKGLFFIENDGNGQGGTTHSLVYFNNEKGGITWFENSWGGKEGLHSFKNKRELVNFIKRQPREMPYLDFGVFDANKHKPGEDLQEFVDICMGW